MNKIPKNYTPAWQGETKSGVIKKIYAIIGKISSITYRRLIDKDGIYLNDNANNQLLVPKTEIEPEENENI